MRTARVQSVPSSIFKNSRQYLHSNELFYRTMQERENCGRQQQWAQQQDRQSTKFDKKRTLKRTSNRLMVRGLQLDAATVAIMHNRLLEYAVKINVAFNRKARISIYQSSL